MPYNEDIARKLERYLKNRKGFISKKMFGGMGWLIQGNMSFGVYKDYLILRMEEGACAEALSHPHTKVFDITGKAMKGWVMVEKAGTDDAALLKRWLDASVRFARSLPAK